MNFNSKKYQQVDRGRDAQEVVDMKYISENINKLNILV